MVNHLYIWVEGSDDERLLKSVVVPLLEHSQDHIEIVLYSQETLKWRVAFLRNIARMGAACWYVADMNSAPCVSARKDRLVDKLPALAADRIAVVVPEIKAWYLAGLNDEECAGLGIKPTKHADSITKERFEALRPKRFDSRIDFMVEILKHYSVDVAKAKSKSFAHFAKRCGI